LKNNIIWIESLDSTNLYLSKLISTGTYDEFFTVASYFQTLGRGQGQNSWHSELGKNILASILIYPDYLPVEKYFYLTKVLSVALVKYLIKISINSEFKIKWPNDIYFKDMKLAGILIQNEIGQSKFNNSIAGIGLNVNQTMFPEELSKPVSLKQINGVSYQLHLLLDEIISEIRQGFELLKKADYQTIDESYLENLYLLNCLGCFKDNKQNRFEATIVDVTVDGKLVIKTNNKTKTYNFKEIEFL